VSLMFTKLQECFDHPFIGKSHVIPHSSYGYMKVENVSNLVVILAMGSIGANRCLLCLVVLCENYSGLRDRKGSNSEGLE
jgi:hypothetical protein